MSRKTVGRRGVLSGSVATVLAAAPGLGGNGGIAHAAPAHQGRNLAQEDTGHPPFLAAFLDWLRTESGRLVLPVSVDMAIPSCSELRVQGVHPAIRILVPQNCEIEVNVEWEGVDWDQLLWLDACEKPGPGGVGWINSRFRPKDRVLPATREALWRADVFEPLLAWINGNLKDATHLAVWEFADSATWARLVYDGKPPNSRWNLTTDEWASVHLLPVHGHQA